jgi:hypothetical protein
MRSRRTGPAFLSRRASPTPGRRPRLARLAGVPPGTLSSAPGVRPIEESDQLLAGGLIQDHVVAETVRARSGVAAGRLRQRVLESGGGCLLVWVRPRARRARAADDGRVQSAAPCHAPCSERRCRSARLRHRVGRAGGRCERGRFGCAGTLQLCSLLRHRRAPAVRLGRPIPAEPLLARRQALNATALDHRSPRREGGCGAVIMRIRSVETCETVR